MIKNRLILTRNLIGMGVIEIEYELNKIMYSPKVTKNPMMTGFYSSSKTTEIYTHVSTKSIQQIKSPFDDL